MNVWKSDTDFIMIYNNFTIDQLSPEMIHIAMQDYIDKSG